MERSIPPVTVTVLLSARKTLQASAAVILPPTFNVAPLR